MSRRTSTLRATVLALVIGVLATLSVSAPARAENPVTPGNFTGYGFDQCQTPSGKVMNDWLKHSPFLAVGIYISGDSRACRDQQYLTSQWVASQLERGWRLLPITLGPQASCQPRFPRYGNDATIIPKPGTGGKYGAARKQGTEEASKTVGVAQSLGIVAGSTLWYDLEGFDLANTNCRESALAFLSAWTQQIHQLGYLSGVYSGAGSGIKMLDDARVNRPGQVDLPDQIWIARWSGVPGRINDPNHTYLRSDGWMPHARVHQYQGGHDETWGSTRINIDRDFLDVGLGSVAAREVHCKGVIVSSRNYLPLKPATADRTPDAGLVRALQCLLTEHGVYGGKISGDYNSATIAAANSWQTAHGLPASSTWSRRSWMTLLVDGPHPVLKYGSAGPEVRRVQRALNAATSSAALPVTGVFTGPTQTALRTWQDRVGDDVDGIVGPETWALLRAGTR